MIGGQSVLVVAIARLDATEVVVIPGYPGRTSCLHCQQR